MWRSTKSIFSIISTPLGENPAVNNWINANVTDWSPTLSGNRRLIDSSRNNFRQFTVYVTNVSGTLYGSGSRNDVFAFL
jgi:hypothetical protein